MAQADGIVSNASGAAVRADLNNQLAAVFTNHSGATEPSTTYAYQWWADTTNGVMKLRNAANSAWITMFQLDGEWTSLALENGTAASPSIYFKDSGTDTGVYSPGADQVGIATAGVQRVNFNGSTEVVFNDGGNDVDFRIEGDTKADLFKIDAGTDTVIIDGITQPSADGTADQSIVTNGSGVLGFASRSRLVSGTAVASTSGTSIDFTGIPSWVKRVTVMFNQVSLSGTSAILVQLGDSGGVETTGYSSTAVNDSGSSTLDSTAGFVLANTGLSAATVWKGALYLNLISTDTFVGTSTLTRAGGAQYSSGVKTLSGTLDRIRITTVNGTDTFDAGSINILYEG